MEINTLAKKLKPKRQELADVLGVSINAVYNYRADSPKKLALMLDGLMYRKLIKLLMQGDIKIIEGGK
jgi:hypothetical protein